MATQQNPVPLLLRGLSQRLLTALMGAFRLGLVAGEGVTLQVFLVSLYRSNPTEVAAFFLETEPLGKLTHELSSIDLSAHEIAPATNPGDPGKSCLTSKMQERLVDLLSQTAKITTETEKRPADVGDFLRVLSKDAAAVTLLQNDLGLTFRRHRA